MLKKLKLSRKLKILISVVLLSLALLALSFGVYGATRNKKSITVEQDISETENGYKKIANTVKSLNDIKKIKSLEVRDSVALLVIENNYKNNKNFALEVAYYLSTENDSAGIQGLRIAYSLEGDDSKKKEIVNTLNSYAREQGIIPENETLPSSYYENISLSEESK